MRGRWRNGETDKHCLTFSNENTLQILLPRGFMLHAATKLYFTSTSVHAFIINVVTNGELGDMVQQSLGA